MRYGNITLGAETTAPPNLQLRTSVVDPQDAASPVLYEVEVHWLVTADAGGDLETETGIDTLREGLTRPGLPLLLDASGLATLDVRAGGTHVPLSPVEVVGFDAAPVAGLGVWEVQWSCRFMLAADQAPASQRRIRWSEKSQVDYRGRTERTVCGTLTASGKQSAAQLKNQFRLAVPKGFRRTKTVWQLSADKRSVEFEIVDTELPGAAFPAGIVAADMQLSQQSEAGPFKTQLLTLQGTVETSPNVPPAHAGKVLCQLADAAIKKTNSGGQVAVPVNWKTTVELYSRRTHVDWQFALAGSPVGWLTTSGLWKIATHEDAAWQQSMNPLWQNAGWAKLQALTANAENESAVIALEAFPSAASRANPNSTTGSAGLPLSFSGLRSHRGVYLAYEVNIRFERKEETFVHQPAVLVSRSAAESETLGGGFQSTAFPVRESGGRPQQRLTLFGRIVRWGQLPSLPVLAHVGGREVWEVQREETVSTLGTFGNLPAEQVDFAITYDVAEYLGSRQGLAAARK
jgi:hypothetical protein